jgi:low affinity Fe/Cu permease
MRETFNRAADVITRALGSPIALFAAAGVIVVWAVTGPIFGFSDSWQLVINTGTTIVTFLMVFVIQNSQNRGAKAVHAKLDELIRAMAEARDELMNAENEPEEMLDRQIAELRALAEAAPHIRGRIAERLGELSEEAPLGPAEEAGSDRPDDELGSPG